MGPKFKFYVDGFLKIWNIADILRVDNTGLLRNVNEQVVVPKTPVSADQLNLAQRIWIKNISESIAEVYFDSTLMFKFDRLGGNLIFSFNDLDLVPTTKGGTGLNAANLAELLTGEDFFALKTAAFKNAGTLAGQVLLLAENNKLPALDGSGLTGISNTPVGTITWHASPNAPAGKLKCNGAQVSRTVYANLFAEIGVIWGEGNGTTTFTLPDLRGEFIRGWDDGRGIDAARAFASFQLDEFKSHRHALYGQGGSSGPQNALSKDSNFNALGEGLMAFAGGSETRPRNRALLPCIHY